MNVAETEMAKKAERIFREYLDLVGVRDGAPEGVRWANLTLAGPHTIRGTGFLELVETEAWTMFRGTEFPAGGIWLLFSRSEVNAGRKFYHHEWPQPAAEHMVAVQAAVDVLVRKEADAKRKAMAEDGASGTVKAPEPGPALEPAEPDPLRNRRWKIHFSGPTTSSHFALDIDELARVIEVIDRITDERLTLCAKREREFAAKGGAA